MGKPDFALAGTWPEDHGMARVRSDIRSAPRVRQIAIVEYVARDGKVHRPDDGPDEWTEILTIVSIHPPASGADADQLGAMLDRARLLSTGQGTLDDAASASA